MVSDRRFCGFCQYAFCGRPVGKQQLCGELFYGPSALRMEQASDYRLAALPARSLRATRWSAAAVWGLFYCSLLRLEQASNYRLTALQVRSLRMAPVHCCSCRGLKRIEGWRLRLLFFTIEGATQDRDQCLSQQFLSKIAAHGCGRNVCKPLGQIFMLLLQTVEKL
jgi:hypothetical protein